MATGLNMFSVVEALSSPVFRKIAALVSPKRGYPELPDLSDNPRPSYICVHTDIQGGPKNIEKYFLQGRRALLPSLSGWYAYVTALHISRPSSVLQEMSI